MKKQILTTSILLAMASGAASAATVYEEDGYKFQVSGDIEVNYKQAVGKDQEAKINLDDADFGFYAESMVSESVTLLGLAKFDGGEAATKSTNISDLYVGAKLNSFKVTVGKQANFIDDVGVSTDYEVGGGYEAWGAGGSVIADSSDQVVKGMYDDGGMFYIGASITQDKDGIDATSDELEQFDVKAGLRFEQVEFTAYFADADKGKTDSDAMILEGRFTLDNLTLAALYGQGSTGSVDTTAMSASAKYKMEDFSYSVGFSTEETDLLKDKSQWYANIGYDVSKNAMLFAEIADNDIKESDLGYAVGMRVFF